MEQLIDLAELQQVLQDLANDIRDNYKEHLQFNDRYTERGVPSGYSQRLIDSVKTQVVVGDRAWEITMTLNDYWKYVENDTNPHFPPVSKILEWVNIKPVLPRPDSRGRIPSPRSLAFLIGRSISVHGTKGSHDLEKVKDGVIPMYKEKIAAALGHDMENYIRKLVVEK
jgi:hypothetical protein